MPKTNIQLYLLSKIVQNFTEELVKEIKELRKVLKGIGIDINSSVPEPFKGNNLYK